MKRSDLINRLIAGEHNILVYGPSGSGKTYFGMTFPKVFCFDFDGGLTTALNPALPQDFEYESYADTPLKDNTAFDRFQKHWNAAVARPEIKTFFIDSLTTLSDHLMRKILGYQVTKSGLPEVQHWGILINKLTQMLYGCIADTAGRILVISAHERFVDADDGTSRVIPLVCGRQLPGRLALWFEETYYAQCTGSRQKPKFELLTIGSSSYQAKSRLSAFAPVELKEPNDWRKISSKVQEALSKLKSVPQPE